MFINPSCFFSRLFPSTVSHTHTGREAKKFLGRWSVHEMNLKQWDLWRLTFLVCQRIDGKNEVLIFFYRGKGRCLETLHWLYRVLVEFAHVKICQDISRNLKPQVPQVRCNVRQAGFKICGQKTSCPTSWFFLRKQQQGDFPLLSAKYCVARLNLGQRYDVKHFLATYTHLFSRIGFQC